MTTPTTDDRVRRPKGGGQCPPAGRALCTVDRSPVRWPGQVWSSQNWVLQAVTAEPLGQDGSHVVPLLRFVAEGLALDTHLLHFIAAHLDDSGGGLISCAYQRIAEESAGVVFEFNPFGGDPPRYPLRPATQEASRAWGGPGGRAPTDVGPLRVRDVVVSQRRMVVVKRALGVSTAGGFIERVRLDPPAEA